LIVPTENNRRQAYLPIGSEVIHNPVGTAPAFYLISGDKILICLPVVPKEMETLMETAVLPLLKRKYNLQGIIKAHVIHLAGIGESVVDSAIGDFERLSNPTVGLLAHPGIVDVRITAKANSIDEADAMIAQIEEKIVAAFPKQIFGFDEETLLKAVVTLAKEKKATVDISSFGLEEYWPEEVNTFAETQLLINNLAQPQKRLQTKYSQRKKATIQVDCIFEQINEESKVTFNILTQGDNRQFVNLYNGPCAQGASWAINILFETIRQTLLELE
jgi:hypothetical protein